MIKFFRKHNKRILVAVTIFLMIVFVGGSALDALLSPSASTVVVAEAFGEPVSQGDLNDVEFQTRILSRLGLNWRVPWLDMSLPPLSEMDYLLLLREARRQGIRANRQRARQRLEDMGTDLNQFSLDYKVSTAQMERILANFLTVLDLWDIARQSMQPSELEVRMAVRAENRRAKANVLEVDSEPLIDQTTEVPEAALEEHFQKYREQLPSDEPLTFGYMIPDRLAVQYIQIDTSKIQLTQPITNVQAERYWRDHKNEFRQPVAEDATPEQKAAAPIFQTFEEAREAVVAELTRQAQLQQGREMADVLWNQLRQPWYSLTTGDDGFYQAPEAVRQEQYYPELIKQLSEELKSPEVISIGRTGLFDRPQAADQLPLGAARIDTQGGARGEPFGASTFLVQGLIDQAPQGARYLSLFETAPGTFIDDDDHLYLYRVIAVEKRHAPESLDEVRDQIIADVRAERAFELAEQHAERVALLIGDRTLAEAWQEYDGLTPQSREDCCGVFQALPFPRVGQRVYFNQSYITIPVTVYSEEKAEGGAFKYKVDSDKFVADVFDLLDSRGPHASGVIPVRELAKCFVVQLDGTDELTRQAYEDQRTQTQRMVFSSRVDQLKREWFSSDRIRARAGYRIAS